MFLVPSTFLDLCSSIPDRRSSSLDPCSSNPPRSSIYDRRSSTLDRTLYVPRSIISTSVRSFHCTMHNSTLATPRLSNLQSWSDYARHPDCTPASFILGPEEVRHRIYDVIVLLTQQEKSRRKCMGAYFQSARVEMRNENQFEEQGVDMLDRWQRNGDRGTWRVRSRVE